MKRRKNEIYVKNRKKIEGAYTGKIYAKQMEKERKYNKNTEIYLRKV